MNCFKFVRNLMLPSGVVLAAAPFSTTKKEEKKEGKKEPEPIRPSELPLYSPSVERKPQQEEDYGPLEEMVGSVRKEVVQYLDTAEGYKQHGWQKLQEQIDKSEDLLNYLKEEENVLPRSGAIVLAGLTGYILGLRGGRFRRLVFTTVGAGSMAGLCYPREAEEYMDTSLLLAKQYVLIGYHLLTQTPIPTTPPISPRARKLQESEEPCIQRVDNLCEVRGTCPPPPPLELEDDLEVPL